jgi:hypothetical protein
MRRIQNLPDDDHQLITVQHANLMPITKRFEMSWRDGPVLLRNEMPCMCEHGLLVCLDNLPSLRRTLERHRTRSRNDAGSVRCTSTTDARGAARLIDRKEKKRKRSQRPKLPACFASFARFDVGGAVVM